MTNTASAHKSTENQKRRHEESVSARAHQVGGRAYVKERESGARTVVRPAVGRLQRFWLHLIDELQHLRAHNKKKEEQTVAC
jgi:hypothetical protein